MDSSSCVTIPPNTRALFIERRIVFSSLTRKNVVSLRKVRHCLQNIFTVFVSFFGQHHVYKVIIPEVIVGKVRKWYINLYLVWSYYFLFFFISILLNVTALNISYAFQLIYLCYFLTFNDE